MLKDELKQAISAAVETVFPETRIHTDEIELAVPKKPEFGDISANIAFRMAKKVQKTPEEISEQIFDRLFNNWPKTLNEIAPMPPVAGYLNFELTGKYYQSELAEILKKKEKYGSSSLLTGKKIQVEFISANPTGPLTLANGRGGFGGDVLANVFEKAGAKVQREYLVNDGGNQVTILGHSLLAAAGLEKESEEVYRGEYIDDWVKNHPDECRKLKEEPQKLGQKAAQEILDNFIKKSVEKMKIKFDNFFSEQKLIESGAVKKAIETFKKKGQVFESEGAIWFETTKFGDDKDRVLIKADGEYTYFANDAAYHWDKFAKRGFDRVVNLWGADHHGYVGRMMAATEAMGFDGRLNIVIMQMVKLTQNGQELKMSKRQGTYITMDDLLSLIGGTVEEASDIARFFFLSRAFNTHIDFNLDLAREHTENNPVIYVKYAYARIAGILRKSEGFNLPKGNPALLTETHELNLIKELAQVSEIVESIVTDKNYPVHSLTFYAENIATKFHAFYDSCRVIDSDNLELTAARLDLVKASRIVLGIVAKDLLGIDTPEKM